MSPSFHCKYIYFHSTAHTQLRKADKRLISAVCRLTLSHIREFKHDVYSRRQATKVNSDFLFFSCNPYINHRKIK